MLPVRGKRTKNDTLCFGLKNCLMVLHSINKMEKIRRGEAWGAVGEVGGKWEKAVVQFEKLNEKCY